MTNKISRTELKARLDSKEQMILVEALPAKYYEDKHLPGALNVPHTRVDELAPMLLPDKSVEIVVYCANGACQSSGIAANRLTELGYTNVRDYDEGKQDWVDAGLPTETSSAAIAH